MDLLRIGSKLVSRSRIDRRITELLALRVEGKSQQEVADALGIDRTFVSRVEALGEIRKGGRIALVGFPIKNVEPLKKAAEDEGVEFVLLLTEDERKELTATVPGADLINEVMDLSGKLRSFDTVLFLGSDMRVEMVEAMIGKEKVVGITLGRSPLTEDVDVDVEEIVGLLRTLRDNSLADGRRQEAMQ